MKIKSYYNIYRERERENLSLVTIKTFCTIDNDVEN